jgi:hypothetical protein
LHQAKNVNDPPTLQDLAVGEQVEAHHIACDTTLLIIASSCAVILPES